MSRLKKYGKPPCKFKVNIDASEYNLLLEYFSAQGEWSHVNYVYFDTSLSKDEADMARLKLRFRARIKGTSFSLELKRIIGEERWEISQTISLEEYRRLLLGIIPDGAVKEKLSRFDLLPLCRIGISDTIRKKISIGRGNVVLDQTCCNSHTVFQVEFRSWEDHLPAQIEIIRGWLKDVIRGYSPKIDDLWIR